MERVIELRRRVVAIVLLLIMAISNLAYTAPIEPGYIIHTGLKKIYTNSTADKVELSQDILRNSHDPNFVKTILSVY